MKSYRRGTNSSYNSAQAKDVSFDADNMWVALVDGRQLGIPLAYFPKLAEATQTQRKKYVLSGGGTGIHWEELDEDLSVQGLMGEKIVSTTKGTRRRKVAA